MGILEQAKIPRAARYEIYDCGDPGCPGVTHMVAFDDDDKPIANIVIGFEAAERLIMFLQDMLHAKRKRT